MTAEATEVAYPSALNQAAALSKSSEVENEPVAPELNQKPSQDEGVKAPAAAKPTEIPEFSLPDVVITGDNELTIGAKRLERPEDDVTLGTRDLSALNRSTNDLPGLDKTLTATSTEDTGASRDAALILRLGGGDLGTFGGWGLLGQNFKGFQYLISGGYSNWGGEPTTAHGPDGEELYHAGFDAEIFPEDPMKYNLSGKYTVLNAPLPYQGGDEEKHQGFDLRGGFDSKLSSFTGLSLQLQDQVSQLTDWNQGFSPVTANEFQGKFHLFFDEVDPFLKTIAVDAGMSLADASGLPPSGVQNYRQEWIEPSLRFKIGEDWSLTAKLKAQEGGGGLDLPLRFYPAADLLWNILESAQLDLSYSNGRNIESFYQNYMETDHLSDSTGFSLPEEQVNEVGLKWTQKISDQSIFSIFGSEGQIRNYHQWADLLSFGPPDYIQGQSTIGLVELDKAGANFQLDFDRNLALSAKYQWQRGVNQSDGRNFTSLPAHQVWVSLLKTENKWDAQLGFNWVSERQAFETLPGSLASYGNLTFSGDYHFDRGFSLWFSAENPLGISYQLQPGYDEPKFYVQAGLELIF
jgi:hypothetical protein